MAVLMPVYYAVSYNTNNHSTAHLPFELAVDVCQDETRDLHKCDDEGAFGQSPQVVADGTCH